MKVIRRDRALSDLADLALYIAQDNQEVADRFLDAVEEAVDRIAQLPYIGTAHPSSNPALLGLRRWPINGFEKYLIFYLVFEDTIDLVRILHSARDLTHILEGE